jgi:Rv0078B-related antitoxin
MAQPMDEPMHPVQIEGLRRMTPAEKLRMVCDLYEAGIRLRMEGLRIAHPDWPNERLEHEARRSLLFSGT